MVLCVSIRKGGSYTIKTMLTFFTSRLFKPSNQKPAMFAAKVQSTVLEALGEKTNNFPLLLIVSGLHNILKFFFTATQSVLLLQNDPFTIILAFGLSKTETAHEKTLSF